MSKNLITLTINGKKIKAPDGQTLLKIIKDQQLDKIPTLCYHPQLAPFSSCFLCVVEIKNFPNLKPACSTVATEGMEVLTKSKRIKESRRTNLELLLSNHYADCYAPCRLGCPANVDIQGYIALTSRGLYQEGLKLMKETNPLPIVCGRICAHPCEEVCRRQHVDQPVDIKNIKRFLADYNLKQKKIYTPTPKKNTNKKVAILGSGPAGLSAAYFLRLQGHQVTIFEKMPLPGGMLRYGIPEYRLPKKDLQQEIDSILDLGIEIHYNQDINTTSKLLSLEKKFEALFLGIGAQLPISMNIPGSNFKNIIPGTEFLKKVNAGEKIDLFGQVFVIGGGNTAIDAARTALRLGAKNVSIIYRRTEAEMPAAKEEIEDTKAEGIKIITLTNPSAYLGQKGNLHQIKIIKMELGPVDQSGRRRPQPIENSESLIKADFVIEALGQKIDSKKFTSLDLNSNGTIKIDQNLFLTNRQGIFAGGDAVSGPNLVINAIAHGRKAAHVIDQYLKGKKLVPENRLNFYIKKEDFAPVTPEDYKNEEKIKRTSIKKISLEKRKTTFLEVEKVFTPKEVLAETKRCLECGCLDIYECKLKEYSDQLKVKKDRFITSQYQKNKYFPPQNLISINTSKCINCGQCLRVCKEIQKQNVFSFDQRGFKTKVIPYDYQPLEETNCIFCGACLENCPTGAISEKINFKKPGPFENKSTISFCSLCGDACPIVIETRDNNLIKISSKKENLCKKGRFQAVSLVPGIKSVSKFLKSCNPKKTLLSISPWMTLEEIDLSLNFAFKNQIDLFSFELAKDLKKIELLKKNKIQSQTLKDLKAYKNIYLLSNFSEKNNSVFFRKIIHNDSEQNIYLPFEVKNTYFRHQQLSSESKIIDLIRKQNKPQINQSLVVFNFQKIKASSLAKFFNFLAENKNQDYLILNNYINYNYLLERTTSLKKIDKKIKNSFYENLISINEKEELIYGSFKERFIFKDQIENFYQKTGFIFDQLGQKKELKSAYSSAFFSIKNFLLGK